MKVLNLIQGSTEWHAHRANSFNASDAPAMMGASKYKTRSQLLHELKTGITPEVTEFQQALFDRGHAAEAAARPHIESLIGEDLYPVVGMFDGDMALSASFDGINMAGDTIFECKLWNQELVNRVLAKDLGPHHYWQLEHQLLVSGAERAIFAVSSEDATQLEWMEYHSIPERRQALLEGWLQFNQDLAAYQHTEEAAPVVAGPVLDLPAVSVQVSGQIAIQDNLEVFGRALTDFVENQLIRKPETDQDFANLGAQIKTLKKAEAALDAEEKRWTEQIVTLNDVKRMKDMLHKMARDNRLMAEKLLEAEKANRRAAIMDAGKKALSEHIANLNADIKPLQLPAIAADFAGAIKGLSSMDSAKDKVAGELARAKIEANRVADLIRANQRTLRELAADHAFLFADAQQLVLKATDDLVAVIKSRIADHAAEQQRKAEAERERIRREEEAKVREQQAQRVITSDISKEDARAAAESIEKVLNEDLTKPYAQGRPGDMVIVDVVAAHFGESRETVVGWLEEIGREFLRMKGEAA